METDQQGLLADEKEEDISCKEHTKTQLEQQEIFVDKVKSTIPFHIAQSTSVDTDRSKETDGKMPLFGNEWQNMGLGTEESKGFSFNMHKFQEKESFICIESCSKETSCLMSNVHGTESTGECVNTTTSKSKGKMSLIGVRRQKNGRYGAVITDRVRHKQVWLGTFDTVEQASQAYFNKKLELENEKLNQQGNKENLDQIQQPGSPIVQCLSVANEQTLDTASVSRINSHETTPHVIEVHKNNWSGEEPETSKETSCLMANVHGTESSNERTTTTNCRPTGKRSLLGIRKQKNGRYGAVITDQIRHKKVWLGTFDTVEEASQVYFSKRFEFAKLSQQGNKDNEPKENCDPIQQPESPVVLASLSVVNDQTLYTAGVDRRNRRTDSHETATHIVEVHKNKMSQEEPESSKETPCLMASVHGTESSNECNTNTSNPKAKISLIGVRRQKNGRYGAVIRDRTRRKQLWLGTFNTVEEASQAYLSKKSELENKKLNQQGTKENRPKENCDQIQQPESPVVLASSSVANDQTSDTARVGRKNRRIDSHETTTHFVEIHKNNMSGEEPETCKETPCLMANVRGTESSDECNTSTRNPKAKIGLIGVRRQKNGRYGAVIRDRTRHKQVWLGTFDTVEEASQAYLTKKSELEKLGQQNTKDNKPKKHCDQAQQPEPPVMASLSGANHDQTLNTAQVSRRNKRIDSHKTPPHFFRVYKRKDSGKYTSEIRNPITKKRIWLGSFVTAEEASQAYQSKELEFQKLLDAKRGCGNEHTHSAQDGISVKLVNVKQGHENANCELESAGNASAETDVRFSNSSKGGTEQRIDSHETGTAEEGFYAYLSKKFDLQSSEKQEGEEDDEDKCLGEWVQLPGNRAVKFSLKLGLPIVDNYGSLLGEFSTLDDLSICKTEDGNEAWLCFA